MGKQDFDKLVRGVREMKRPEGDAGSTASVAPGRTDGQSGIRLRRRQLRARIANEEGQEQRRSSINSMETEVSAAATPQGKAPWNKGKLVGQKAPLKLKDVWAIRIRLQIEKRVRELAPLDLGIDSKLRACDLVGLRVRDVCQGDRVSARAIVMQRKTQRPVQFEITPTTREALDAWIKAKGLKGDSFLFPSRVRPGEHLGTRQYARMVHHWMGEIGLDTAAYGTHSLRRTKPSLICRRTKNLRAVQLLLGHSKLESTVRYLGIDVDDALEIAEQTEV